MSQANAIDIPAPAAAPGSTAIVGSAFHVFLTKLPPTYL